MWIPRDMKIESRSHLHFDFSFSVGTIRILESPALDVLTGIGFTYPVTAFSPKLVSTWLSPWAGFKTRPPPRQNKSQNRTWKDIDRSLNYWKIPQIERCPCADNLKGPEILEIPAVKGPFCVRTPFHPTCFVLQSWSSGDCYVFVGFGFGSVDFKTWVSACRALDA